MFKESFKYFKSKSVPPDLSKVVDFDEPIDDTVSACFGGKKKKLNLFSAKQIAIPQIIKSDTTTRPLRGLRAPSTWKVYRLRDRPGLIFIRNPFTEHGQRYWIARCCRDYPRAPHAVNIVNNKSIDARAIDDWWAHMQSADTRPDERQRLMTAMRWATLGYHHDWDTKVYSDEKRHEFPLDLAELSRFVAAQLGWADYAAEAAIVNFYPQGTTLAGHTDHSERNLEAPLFSFRYLPYGIVWDFYFRKNIFFQLWTNGNLFDWWPND